MTYYDIFKKWDHIKRRLRTRNGGHRISAMLNGCRPDGFLSNNIFPELSPEKSFTLYILTPSQFHYKELRQPKNINLLLWAIAIETGDSVVTSIVFNPPGCVCAYGSSKPPIEEAIEILEKLDF